MKQGSTTITQEKRYRHAEGRMNAKRRPAPRASSFRGITVIERRTGCGTVKYQSNGVKWDI